MENEILSNNYLYELISAGAADEPAFRELKDKLAANINDLLLHDFSKLVELLYRLDVDENRLRTVLKGNREEDAGQIIAGLIIERQLLKMKTREQYKQRNEEDSSEEKW